MSILKNESVHISVLLEEVVSYLRAEQGGQFLDCTFGGGGHTRALLAAHPSNRVVACDRDAAALQRGAQQFAKESRLILYKSAFADFYSCFDQISPVLGGPLEREACRFDGVVADLGLSTDQLKGGRGFSFEDSACLDMRMDREAPRSAYEVVNESEPRELTVILKRGGVGEDARRIVQAIVAARPVESARDLASIVERAVPRRKKSGAHPATVVFQALRIEVNQEIQQIEKLLAAVPKMIKPGGRLAVIAFHSLEDKLVAGQMRRWADPDTTPARWRSADAPKGLGKLLTKKALTPSAAEISRNPSSRSALLRVFEFEGVQ